MLSATEASERGGLRRFVPHWSLVKHRVLYSTAAAPSGARITRARRNTHKRAFTSARLWLIAAMLAPQPYRPQYLRTYGCSGYIGTRLGVGAKWPTAFDAVFTSASPRGTSISALWPPTARPALEGRPRVRVARLPTVARPRPSPRLAARHPTQPAVDRGAVPTPCVIDHPLLPPRSSKFWRANLSSRSPPGCCGLVIACPLCARPAPVGA